MTVDFWPLAKLIDTAFHGAPELQRTTHYETRLLSNAGEDRLGLVREALHVIAQKQEALQQRVTGPQDVAGQLNTHWQDALTPYDNVVMVARIIRDEHRRGKEGDLQNLDALKKRITEEAEQVGIRYEEEAPLPANGE